MGKERRQHSGVRRRNLNDMVLKDGYTDVPAGKIATVVTHLQMLTRAPTRRAPPLVGASIRPVADPAADWYRDLYRRIGAQDWLWFSRLKLANEALRAIIRDPNVEIFALVLNGRDEGLLELDFRVDGDCELAFFGVTASTLGQGAGRLLMNEALARAWSRPIRRFWVHTCTWDHPAALEFYMRSGFEPFRQQVEVVDDPRLTGLIPESAAPHVPLIRQ